MGVLVLVLVGVILLIKGYLSLIFSFSGLGSWLLFIWFLFSILFLLVFLGEIFRVAALSFFAGFSRLIWFLLIYLIFSLFIIINVWWQVVPLGRETKSTPPATKAGSTCEVQNLVTPEPGVEIIENNNFDRGLNEWTTQVYYKPGEDKFGQISEQEGIITFKATEGTPNSRAGVMQDLNADVSGAKSIILKVRVRADESVLGGSGWQGREAPIALAAIYYDENCVLHSSLPEDPKATAGRMFWHGFYFQEPSGKEIIDFATRINKGEWYEYQYDLSELKPKIIRSIGFEGAGWAPRNGSIDWISLKIEK